MCTLSLSLIIFAFKCVCLSFIERLAEGEFIQGILDNEDALHFIQYEPPK